jgi:HAD superfamily hydrolase (TIGR01509 family)
MTCSLIGTTTSLRIRICYPEALVKPTAAHEIQGVLFDWDGTLIDSYAADSAAYLAMFGEMGISWGLKELARYYSPNWYNVYKAAGLPRHRWNDADAAWRKHYARHRPRLLAGARAVLRWVGQRHQIGLVTSGDRERVTRQLREFRLTRTFAVRVCSGDTPRRKPHPAPLQLALRHLKLKPAACVYVGDSPEDLEMAGRAGVCAIAVLGPFPTEKRLRAARPEFLLESINELPQLLKQLQGGRNKRSAV